MSAIKQRYILKRQAESEDQPAFSINAYYLLQSILWACLCIFFTDSVLFSDSIPDGVAPFSAKSFLPLSVRYIHHGTDKYGCIRIAVD